MDQSLGNNLIKFFSPVLFHKVEFHELLGHGFGKLFCQDSQGNLNFNKNTINPITGKPIESWYKSNETWASVIGKLNNPYQECRADSVALYFSCFPEASAVLQPEFKNDWKYIMEGVFTEFVLAGVGSLEFYNPDKNKFSQAHVNGRFVILRVLLEAENGFITIEKTKNEEGKDWISIKIDKEQILTTGFNAMKNFLLKLNVFKATADFTNASKMFGDYSTPDEFLLSLRPIILANKKPRRIEIQGNIDVSGHDLVYKTYPENFEGVIQSFKERFNLIDHEMFSIWEEKKEYIKPLLKN